MHFRKTNSISNKFVPILLSSILFSILECLSGYYGPSCSYPCRYPNYGKDCQSKCVCDEERCNPIKGCEQKSNPYFMNL